MPSDIQNKVGSILFYIAVAAFGLALLLSLTGCSSLPTVQQCSYVSYERTGMAVSISAECTASPGGDWL